MVFRFQTVPGLAEKRCAVKALRGRGRKRHDWVEYLHQIVVLEFEWHSSKDEQSGRSLIKYIALTLLGEENSASNSSYVDPTTSRQISEHVRMKQIDSFLIALILSYAYNLGPYLHYRLKHLLFQ